MQSIFRPASRREVLWEHAGGSRRGGGLKMGWTKRSGCGDSYGYRLPARSWMRIWSGRKWWACGSATDGSRCLRCS